MKFSYINSTFIVLVTYIIYSISERYGLFNIYLKIGLIILISANLIGIFYNFITQTKDKNLIPKIFLYNLFNLVANLILWFLVFTSDTI
ncbi:hypothetical protein EDL98_00505 [Ornithobacterium rhinotracheale]|nr:hypothetical protein [Ornithobacterium rhinotracheale]